MPDVPNPSSSSSGVVDGIQQRWGKQQLLNTEDGFAGNNSNAAADRRADVMVICRLSPPFSSSLERPQN